MFIEIDPLDAIRVNLGAGPAMVVFDGRFHHFPIENSRDAGWYIARLTPTGRVVHYGDWRTDAKYTWSPGTATYAPTAEQIAEQERRQQQRILESTRQADQAAGTAAAIWNAAPQAEQHPYLESKGIPAFFTRILTPEAIDAAPQWIQKWIERNGLEGALIVPVGRAGQLVSLQFICADGKKRYLPHGAMKAGRCIIGNLNDAPMIAVAEGFATGASVHLATGYPVVIAFDAGNIADVVAGLRRDYPDASIVVLADNDVRSHGSKLLNTGVEAARAAAVRYGCKVAIPELNGQKCDFNDVFLALGADAVRAAIEAACKVDEAAESADPGLSAQEASVKLQDEIDAFLDAAGTDDQYDLTIRGAAGLGKSTVAAATIHQRQIDADVFVPSHKVAQEQAERLPDGVAIAIRGRTHQTPDSAPLCQKHEAAALLAKAGLASQTMPLLCGKVDPATGRRACPYASQCEYLKQFSNPAPVRYHAHEWLPLPESQLSESSGRKPAVAVIDESFRDALEKYRNWPIAELFCQPEPVYMELATAIRDGKLMEMQHCIPAINDILAQDDFTITVHPEMDAATAARILKPYAEQQRKPLSFLRRCKTAIEQGAVNALWYSHNANSDGFIHEAHVDPIKFIKAGIPKLFLDASAADCIIKIVSPNCRIVDIAVQRNVEIIQIADTAMSYRRLREDNGYLSSQILELAFRLHNEGGQGAVIAPKEWLDKHGHRLPAGVITGHYGALRGLNAMENADWLIQVGRCEPPLYAVERAVRAWFPTDPLIGAAIPREQAELRDKAGHGAIIHRTGHDDPRCVELLQSSREQESLQALDRLRLVHHTGKPKRVFLLTNLPLPGAIPDTLTTLDALTLPGRLAEVMIRDGALILNRRYLAEKHPDLFKNAGLAHQAVKEWRDASNGRFSYIDTYRDSYHLNPANSLTVMEYRTVKQVGKNRQAITYDNLDAQGLLTTLHGETVKPVAARPLTPAPETPPMNPTPAEIAPHTPEPELSTVLETEIAELNEVSEPVAKLSTAPVIQVEALEPAVIRAVAWTVIFNDGHTATMRDPDRPTIDAALIVAQRLMPGAVRVQAIH